MADIPLQIFDVKFYGAVADGVTDDTVSIQSAINACVEAGGGTVLFQFSENPYVISGPLLTSVSGVNPNCQLYFPLVTLSNKMVTVRLLGEVKPNFSSEGVEAAPRNQQGVILESKIQGTGTLPTVIGMPWSNSGVTGMRNYITIMLENMIVRTSTKSGNTDIAGTMSAVNLERACQAYITNFKADVSSALVQTVEPTNATYGLILPNQGNKAEIVFSGNVFVEGYKYGIKACEHLTAHQIIIAGCANGIEIPAGDHMVTILHYCCELNKNNILVNGKMNINIFSYETEHYVPGDLGFIVLPSRWYNYVKDIDWLAGTDYVNITHSNVKNSGGAVGTFSAHASAKYNIQYGVGNKATTNV